VELKEVKLSEGYYVMDHEKAVEMVDENTICVAAILGSTLNGEFEDVKRLNDLLVEKKKETGQVFLLLSIYIYIYGTTYYRCWFVPKQSKNAPAQLFNKGDRAMQHALVGCP
jgi:hypothetical protein